MTAEPPSPPPPDRGGLFEALREDRPLLVVTIALVVAVLVPLATTPILPAPDLHTHAGAGGALLRSLRGDSVTATHYRVVWELVPYWTTYVVLALGNVVGPFFAAKLLTGVVAVATPLAWMRLLAVTGRPVRLGLLAFVLAWDRNLLAGWHANVLGNALAVLALSYVAQTHARFGEWKVGAAMAAVALTHPLSAGYAWLLAFGWIAATPGRRWVDLIPPSVGLGVVLGPWLARSWRAGGGRWHAELAGPGERLAAVPACTSDMVTGTLGETAAVAALAVLVGAAVLARTSRRLTPWVPCLVALGLFACLPLSVGAPIEHWGTYFRFATPAVLGLVLVLDTTSTPRWPLLVAPLATALVSTSLSVAFAGFGERVRPFLDVARAVPRGADLYPLEAVDDDPRFRAAPLAHLHSYLSAEGVRDPHLFRGIPVALRAPSRPELAWGKLPRPLLDREVRRHDLLLVQGPTQGVEGEPWLRLLASAGEWRLYAVHDKLAP